MATPKKPQQPPKPTPAPVPDRKGHSTVGRFDATGNWSVSETATA